MVPTILEVSFEAMSLRSLGLSQKKAAISVLSNLAGFTRTHCLLPRSWPSSEHFKAVPVKPPGEHRLQENSCGKRQNCQPSLGLSKYSAAARRMSEASPANPKR